MSELFGLMPAGDPVYRVCLSNNHAEVRLLTFGAVIQSIEVPDRDGQRRNVALGLSSLEDYIAHSPHFGAVPGRYAGRIDHGRFRLDGTDYQLTISSPPHTLHGGRNGFGKRNWAISSHSAAHLELVLISPDGDEGFPGTVETTVRYSLDGPELTIDFFASTDAATILNLTNHSYFNLCGEGDGDVFGHILSIDANDFLPIRPDGIPTGEVMPVAGTPFDFRVSCPASAVGSETPMSNCSVPMAMITRSLFRARDFAAPQSCLSLSADAPSPSRRPNPLCMSTPETT